MTSVASDEVEFEALATSVIKRLHAAFKAKESLASTPQLWRAVSIEHQLFQHTNASRGHRKTHDFRHDAALVQVYEQTAADLIGYVERKRDFHNWETLTKHQRAGQMKSAFREYLTERGLVRPSKKPKKAKLHERSEVNEVSPAHGKKKKKEATKQIKPKKKSSKARDLPPRPPAIASS